MPEDWEEVEDAIGQSLLEAFGDIPISNFDNALYFTQIDNDGTKGE